MTADQEARLAVELEEAQHLVWERLLSYRPLAQLFLERVLRDWRQPPAEVLGFHRTLATRARSRTRAACSAIGDCARRAAPFIRRFDADRTLLEEFLAEVTRRAELTHPAAGHAYANYLATVRVARAREQVIRHEFITRNLGLVVAIAARYANVGMPFSDLVQEGNIGLLKAVDRFDVHRGFRFSTSASWWIRHALTRAVADRGKLVREPLHLCQARARLARARSGFAARLGRAATVRELAQVTGLSERRVEAALLPSPVRVLSLDGPASLSDERTLHESLADPRAADGSPPEALAHEATLRHLGKALARLRPMEIAVIRKRFGFQDEETEFTLAEIGADFGVSRERIRQIQEQALRKLRKFFERSNAAP